MLLTSIRVINYKGFRDSGSIDFGPGFNVLIGKNNSGKTSLLEALSFSSFAAKPHRSIDIPKDALINPHSTRELRLQLSGAELRFALLRSNSDFFFAFDRVIPNDSTSILSALESLLSTHIVNLSVKFTDGNIQMGSRPTHSLFPEGPLPDRTAAHIGISDDKQGFVYRNQLRSYEEENSGLVAAPILLRTGIYVFRAERLSLGSSPITEDPALALNAQNLAGVLLLLLGRNRSRFERLMRYVRYIFPSIYEVRPAPTGSNQAVLRVWQIDPTTERDDLAVSLDDSGTGVGQVLAMLYVATNADAPLTIVIDEPNSFLHPGATRKLIQLLRSEPELQKHQYIISTHSPDIIRVAEPTTLHLTAWNGKECVVSKMDVREISGTRRALLEVGARLSDVFGSDAILWVEGATEQECFPKIIAQFNLNLPIGTAIIPVRSTDELGYVSAELLWEVYRRVSSANALIPRTIAFSLDREAHSPKKLEDLRRASGGMIKFLSRRT